MSELNPSINFINGSGTPRLVLVEATAAYTSSGTTAYTATGITETGSPAYTEIQIGMRVSSYRVVSGLSYPTYAKITAKATGVLTVDAWNNGTPTAAQTFTVDGWITDLPRCQEMTESFEPDVLIHSIYAGDKVTIKETKHRGWIYTCILDYSKFASADLIMSLKYHLAQKATDKLVLIPRNDQPGFQYNVYYGDKIELTKNRLTGYRKPVFVFKGKENLASWPIISGYGTGYATSYGTGL